MHAQTLSVVLHNWINIIHKCTHRGGLRKNVVLKNIVKMFLSLCFDIHDCISSGTTIFFLNQYDIIAPSFIHFQKSNNTKKAFQD